MKKRLLCMAICIAIMFSYVSVPVGAADDGDENLDWIEVYTIEDLYSINDDMCGNYKLMNDIDLSEDTALGGDWDFIGQGWDPIGSGNVYGATDFEGVFDGNGYEISGIRINVTRTLAEKMLYVGLFASNSGTIKNLTLTGDIYVKAAASKGGKTIIGAVAAHNTGRIVNCLNKCNIDAQN